MGLAHLLFSREAQGDRVIKVLWKDMFQRKKIEPTEDGEILLPDETIPFGLDQKRPLELDVYNPRDGKKEHTCILFVTGGGFRENHQRGFGSIYYCRKLTEAGFVVISVDYRRRLSLISKLWQGSISKTISLFEQAIMMATEDLMRATRHVIDNANYLSINPNRIYLLGSSAGAIASLQSDFERCNHSKLAQKYLPEGFRYAGILSFSGAIFSRTSLTYPLDIPAPTLLVHGEDDIIVPYRQIKLFRIGFYGSKRLSRLFRKRHYVYHFIHYAKEGHIASGRYLANLNDSIAFIQAVETGQHFEIEEQRLDDEVQHAIHQS